MGIDLLVQKLLDTIELLRFFVVCNVFERGVRLRLGNFNKEIGAENGIRFPIPQLHWKATKWFRWSEPTGFHWIIPCNVDIVHLDNVAWRTEDLGVQSLTTADNVSVSLRAAITCRIRNIQKSLLEVESVDEALEDSCAGAIGAYVTERTWAELLRGAAIDELVGVCQKNATRYGLEINRVQFKDLTTSRSLRLLMQQPKDTPIHSIVL